MLLDRTSRQMSARGNSLLDREYGGSCDTAAEPGRGHAEPVISDALQIPLGSSKLASASPPPCPAWLVALLFVATPVMHAIPWLFEGFTWCGWLGIAGAMGLALSSGLASRFWMTWFWCSCALGAAFHWSPAAMAYTLSSGFTLGLAVALPLIAWDGLRLALGFWLATKLTRDVRFYWLAAATTTIGLEYLMPGVFPWKLGLTQLSLPWLIQGIDVFGPSFSTLVAFTIAGAIQFAAAETFPWRWAKKNRDADSRLAFALRGVRRTAISPPVVLMGCIALYNAFAWNHWGKVMNAAAKIRVGLVQVDPSFVESTASARAKTESIAEQVDFVCWPESSGGNYDLRLDCLANDEKNFQMSRDPERGMRPWPIPKCELLLAGKNYVGDADAPTALFVTAMLVDEQEKITSRHNKRFLMPFGEYVPGERYIPGLAELFDMSEYVQPGDSALPIQSTCGARIGTMLCYEDMVPQAAREMVASDSNLLVSLVNGSAFESPYTLYQHRLIAHLRAIENRRYFLRCAATGETCVIDPRGEIIARLPVQTQGALVCEIGLLRGQTMYGRFPWLLPVLGCGILVSHLRYGRKRTRN